MSGASNNVMTIVISVPEGVSLSIGAKINVNGHEVGCNTVNWKENSCLKADYLEQRLSVALDVLPEYYGAMEDYEARILALKEDDELIELED